MLRLGFGVGLDRRCVLGGFGFRVYWGFGAGFLGLVWGLRLRFRSFEFRACVGLGLQAFGLGFRACRGSGVQV